MYNRTKILNDFICKGFTERERERKRQRNEFLANRGSKGLGPLALKFINIISYTNFNL